MILVKYELILYCFTFHSTLHQAKKEATLAMIKKHQRTKIQISDRNKSTKGQPKPMWICLLRSYRFYQQAKLFQVQQSNKPPIAITPRQRTSLVNSLMNDGARFLFRPSVRHHAWRRIRRTAEQAQPSAFQLHCVLYSRTRRKGGKTTAKRLWFDTQSTRDILPTKMGGLPSNDSRLTGSVTGHIAIVGYNLAWEANAGHTQVLVDSCTPTKDAPLWWSGQQPRHECKLKATGDSGCPRQQQQHKRPHV